MPRPSHPRHTRQKQVVALLLTFAAGVVDIVGYLALYHTFTAHMTGTTVHLGNSLIEGHWPEAIIAASVVGAFMIGSVAGRTIIEIGARKRFRNIASVTLAIEAMLLLVFIRTGTHALATHGSGESTPYTAPLLAMLAAAMGLQTATLTRIGPLSVHTTFVTGMLNKLAQVISHALSATWDALTCAPDCRAQHISKRRDSVSKALFLFGIWLLYLAGAGSGTALDRVWGLRALFVPVVLIVLTMGADMLQPLSIEEEQDELDKPAAG
jgi:uncharacterized membrane protein YoaK (UPF0700 family)